MVKPSSEFWLFILRFQGAKTICAPKVLIWGFGGYWRFLTGVLHLDLDLDMVTGLWFSHVPNFVSLSWICRFNEYLCPLSLDLGLWRTLELPNWGLASWSWFGYGHLSLFHPYSEFWLFILILKMKRRSRSFKSWYGNLEDSRGSGLGFSILIFFWIGSLVFGTPIILILALFLDFKGAKIIHVL